MNADSQWNPVYNAFHLIFVVETKRFVGSFVNVTLTRQTCGQRSSRAAECKHRALENCFSERMCYMFELSKCRGDRDLDLCTTSLLAFGEPCAVATSEKKTCFDAGKIGFCNFSPYWWLSHNKIFSPSWWGSPFNKHSLHTFILFVQQSNTCSNAEKSRHPPILSWASLLGIVLMDMVCSGGYRCTDTWTCPVHPWWSCCRCRHAGTCCQCCRKFMFCSRSRCWSCRQSERKVCYNTTTNRGKRWSWLWKLLDLRWASQQQQKEEERRGEPGGGGRVEREVGFKQVDVGCRRQEQDQSSEKLWTWMKRQGFRRECHQNCRHRNRRHCHWSSQR